MTEWPQTIPHDLKQALEAIGSNDQWLMEFRGWAKHHKLKLKIQWFGGLTRRLGELDKMRFTQTDQDRWGVVKEWLDQNGVLAPDWLAMAP